MFPIQQNTPMPKTLRAVPATNRKYPFASMAVGDMFFVPGKTRNTLTTHASTMGKALGRKFTTRLVYMIETKQGWVSAETPNDKGAVLGVGVWRTK